MPNYYSNYPTNYAGNYYTPIQQVTMPQQYPQYMINVDGEMSARAWQMPSNLPPNTIIPLFDLDGQHVYFKSIDAYGRQNPLRKGQIVFEEDKQMSEAVSAVPAPDMSNYVTKADLEALRQEIQNLRISGQNQNNQNRNNNRGDR